MIFAAIMVKQDLAQTAIVQKSRKDVSVVCDKNIGFQRLLGRLTKKILTVRATGPLIQHLSPSFRVQYGGTQGRLRVT